MTLDARLKKLEGPPPPKGDWALPREEIDRRIRAAVERGDEWLVLFGKALPPECWAAV